MSKRQGAVIVLIALAFAGAALWLSQRPLVAPAAWAPGDGNARTDLRPVVPIEPPASELPAASPPERLDDSQLASLLAGVRKQVGELKGQDLLALPRKEGPFSPLFEEPVPTAAELQAPLLDAKPSAEDADVRSFAEAYRGSLAGSKPPFDPYPRDTPPAIPPLEAGHHPGVHVLAPGRLDWTFVTSSSSLDPERASLMQRYSSTDQTYELYVPPGYDPNKYYPLLIHVSPGGANESWGVWHDIAERHGVFVAGPYNAGNNVPMPRRCRTVLDVLDDVRRRFRIDPDRTYISGISGGGNVSSRIAFALPELFGGNIAIVGTWNLRSEPALRRRVRERLSVAVVTGAGDFNGPEMANEFYPVLTAHHVRARLWVYPDMGHGVPNSARLEEIFHWLEDGLPERRANAAAFPASRLVEPLDPAAWSTAQLLEACDRLKLPGKTSGLFLLQEVAERWKGEPAADVAQRLQKEFDAHSPAPWDKVSRAELLRFRYLQCQRLDEMLSRPLPSGYPVPRSNLVQIGLRLWEEIRDLSPPGSPVAAEAADRLGALKKESR